MVDVLVIGGGLAGLFNAILLNRAGLTVTLLEKKQYPFHRVCGEYISNEVIPFLENQNLYPADLEPVAIKELEISATNGSHFIQTLELGGFGVSRYSYDYWLSKVAKNEGVDLRENTTATEVKFDQDLFTVTLQNGAELIARYVIGAFGKRAKLDQQLSRPFLKSRSPYMGVKYHMEAELPANRISLHNFHGGYCGMSMVEDQKFNLCYLVHRDAVKKHGSIDAFEERVMSRNPRLAHVFSSSRRLFEKPEVINEITFEKQEPLYDHIFMCGDAAGMITPLCGNGMAMAIRSATQLSAILISAKEDRNISRSQVEDQYIKSWNDSFRTRLWFGRKIQKLFGHGTGSNIGVGLGKYFKPVTRALIRQTHGMPFS